MFPRYKFLMGKTLCLERKHDGDFYGENFPSTVRKRQEITRISWANRRETGLATITVFAMATIAAVFFLLVDAILSNVVQFLLNLGS